LIINDLVFILYLKIHYQDFMKNDLELARYIFNYFFRLLNLQEKQAYWHYIYSSKALYTKHLIAKQDALQAEEYYQNDLAELFFENKITKDPTVLKLLEEGWENFMLQTAERVIKDSSGQIYFNLCPQCGQLARTPQAKQCRCGHQWRESNRI
jgi:hypothetical protein